jgi:hypothetical protein
LRTRHAQARSELGLVESKGRKRGFVIVRPVRHGVTRSVENV